VVLVAAAVVVVADICFGLARAASCVQATRAYATISERGSRCWSGKYSGISSVIDLIARVVMIGSVSIESLPYGCYCRHACCAYYGHRCYSGRHLQRLCNPSQHNMHDTAVPQHVQVMSYSRTRLINALKLRQVKTANGLITYCLHSET